MAQRLTMVIGVHLLLRRGTKVLLARRFNTGWADGSYNLPCGHLDDGETAIDGMIREAREEVGVKIARKNLSFIGATHWKSTKQSVNLFFECRQWQGEARNLEPEKCDDLSWFDLKKLPRNIVPQSKAVLRALKTVPFLIENV